MELEIVKGLALKFEGSKSLESIEKVGIENLKVVAAFSINLRKKIVKYKKDGRIDLIERFGLGFSIIGVIKLIPIWAQIRKEILDLDKDEYTELISIVADGFDANLDFAKEYFEDFLNFVDMFRFFITK